MLVKEVTIDFANGLSKVVECYDFKFGKDELGNSIYVFYLTNDATLTVLLDDLNNTDFDTKYYWEFEG
jgi:hypothetical protein